MRKQAARYPELQASDRLHGAHGGFRRHDPVHTFDKYKHLISPVSGPVTYLHPMPGRHAGSRKVYVSGYLVCPSDIPRGNSFDKICAGKGQTDEQAKASALCEALERFSGVYQGDEVAIRGSMRDIGSKAIHFNDLQNFSDWQFENRAAVNALTTDRRKQVPQRFNVDAVIDWTPVWSLSSGEQRYVPLCYCYAESPDAGGRAFGIHNPNGNAAGNGLEEAILQAMLELVERDAVAIWWYNRIRRPAVPLAAFADSYFDQLAREYQDLGWRLWMLDLTHDLGIPVYAAIARQADSDRYAIGFGCHLSAQLAAQRALTELNQLFDAHGGAQAPWDSEKMQDTGFLFPSADEPAPMISRLGAEHDANLKSNIEHCVQRLRSKGLEVLVVDKTRPDIGLSVVQVIVPGLRHFWPRLGPGRLYTVPKAMGWLDAELAESQLNAVPLFL
jgi:ribosomal protein S12 methylthiotransferase accessory factor